MPIGDVTSAERGSGARYNDGKPDLSLIPLETLYGEARVWEHGAKKYARFNWQKGMNWSVPLGSLLRHLAAWQAGEDIDPESGENHLDHVACNIRMLRYYTDNYKEGDDRVVDKESTRERIFKASTDLVEGEYPWYVNTGVIPPNLPDSGKIEIERRELPPKIVEVSHFRSEYLWKFLYGPYTERSNIIRWRVVNEPD